MVRLSIHINIHNSSKTTRVNVVRLILFTYVGSSSGVWTLTAAFFMLNLLAAAQDVAVDGWALTMLSR